MSNNILQNLKDKDIETISRELKLFVSSENLWNNDQLLNQIFNLLNHDEYPLRGKAFEILKFLIRVRSSLHEILSNYLLKVIGNSEFDLELWFRCLELFTLLPKKTLPEDFIIKIFDSEGNYVQGFLTFLIREKKEYDPNIGNLIDYIEDKLLEVNSDTKKSFIWIFWKKKAKINPRIIKLLCKLTEDPDREVRRLSCEILVQFVNDPRFSQIIFETLEKRITDESWRVQRVAIKCLLQSTQNLYREDEHFWTKVVGLFWNTIA